MLQRLIPGFLVAVALVATVLARPDDRKVEMTTLSHGAGECETDGVSVGYEVAFDESSTPKGFRVRKVTVDDIATQCDGHDLVVFLTAGAAEVGRTNGTVITGTSMTLALRDHPLAEEVDGVEVRIDEGILPPADPTPTPTATATPTPSETATPQPSVTTTPTVPSVEPAPTTSPSPTPTNPGLIRDPNGEPLGSDECDPAIAVCGTTGDDTVTITDGTYFTGPGQDSIDITTGPETGQIDVFAGIGADDISITINAASGTTQFVNVDAGPGADLITLDFDNVEPGAVVVIFISGGGGADVMWIPAFLPPGVTVEIAAGLGDDVITTTGSSSTTSDPTGFDWGEAGYEIYGAVTGFTSSGGYRLYGNGGADTLRGGLGADRVIGGRGGDTIAGGAGHDLLRGGRASDVFRGQAGNDRILGGRGGDSLYGGRGNDELIGGPHKDACYSGKGRDLVKCERRAQ